MGDQSRRARGTLPGLLLDRARRTPDSVAYRAKELGIYRETTWQDLSALVTKIALALQARSLRPAETVAIMGHACPEWTIADLAVQAAGGVSYGIYPTVAPAELALLLNHGGARFMVAEDQEYLDRVLAVWPSCPALEAVFVRAGAPGRRRPPGGPVALIEADYEAVAEWARSDDACLVTAQRLGYLERAGSPIRTRRSHPRAPMTARRRV